MIKALPKNGWTGFLNENPEKHYYHAGTRLFYIGNYLGTDYNTNTLYFKPPNSPSYNTTELKRYDQYANDTHLEDKIVYVDDETIRPTFTDFYAAIKERDETKEREDRDARALNAPGGPQTGGSRRGKSRRNKTLRRNCVWILFSNKLQTLILIFNI